MARQTFEVSGMSCEHCVSAVAAEVERVPGVEAIEVDLAAGRVAVDGAPDPERVREAIDAAGYDVTS